MQKTNYDKWAQSIAERTGFELGEKIYEGIYYSKDNVRNAIYAGNYNRKPVVLKMYDDPRTTDEPIALESFHKANTSKILTAPKLYKYEIESPNKGWLIEEKLPEGGRFFSSPLNENEKKEFARLYLEYRKNFPTKPTRELALLEQLSAEEYYTNGITRWLKLANEKESQRRFAGEEQILNPKEFIPRYEKAIKTMRRILKGRKMIWIHGHFKPNELYKVSNDKYYLIDFAHSKMAPEGSELAFIIWSDHIMDGGDWNAPYEEWREGISEWKEAFEEIKNELKLKDYNDLLRANLLERSLGAITADITASDRPYEEKIKRVSLLYQLIDELLE